MLFLEKMMASLARAGLTGCNSLNIYPPAIVIADAIFRKNDVIH